MARGRSRSLNGRWNGSTRDWWQRRAQNPCIRGTCAKPSAGRKRCGRGRSSNPEPQEVVGEQESPRPNRHRRRARTVVRSGAKPARIMTQGGARAVSQTRVGAMEQSELVAVGIDVSKEGLEIAVGPSGEEWSERNDLQSVRRLVKGLPGQACGGIGVAARGGD